MTIHGQRVKLARDVRGWTQAELARRVGVSQPAIAQIESGVTQPAAQTLDAVAFATRFPPSFFRQPPPEDFPLGSLSLLYRARASAKSRDLDTAHAWATLVWACAREMAAHLDPIPVRLPRLSGSDAPTAARVARSELGLPPDLPLERVLLPVERAGVFALALPVTVPGLDAFSVWAGEAGGRPVIVVAREPAGDRLRFSVAHELGHLVMHSPIRGTVSQLEREADEFAAEFLVPEEAFRRDVAPPVTLAGLALLKPKWRVSVAALIRRARETRLVSEPQYRALMKQLSARGWRKQEPDGLAIPAEKPRAVRKMAEVVYGTPNAIDGLASAMRLLRQTAEEIVAAHADASELRAGSVGQDAGRKVVGLRPQTERRLDGGGGGR